MPTLGTQNISDSYPQLLKTFGTGGLDGNLQIVTDGDNTSSALKLSTTGVNSSGSLSVDGATTLTGAVTFGTSITASTGTATVGTLSVGTQSVGTSTVGISTISTATISTATIPTVLGATTFASTITASTGTNTLGTINTNTATIGTLTVTNGASIATTSTFGTAQFGASGPKLTAVSYGTAAFTSATAPQYNAAQTTSGTFGLTGAALNDIVIGTINSVGSATGTVAITTDFHVVSTNVVRYVVNNGGNTAGTIPAGTIFATAMRFTA
jgi:hypothetical protein